MEETGDTDEFGIVGDKRRNVAGHQMHVCPYCEYSNSRKCHIMEHIRTHTGEKPYACCYCPYRTARNGALTRHMLVHTGEKRFACPHCSYRATQKAHVRRHLLTHTNSTSLFSWYCKHQFSSQLLCCSPATLSHPQLWVAFLSLLWTTVWSECTVYYIFTCNITLNNKLPSAYPVPC